MNDIKFTDGSVIRFEKDKEKNRYIMKIFIEKKTITLHLDRNTINLISFELDDLLNPIK